MRKNLDKYIIIAMVCFFLVMGAFNQMKRDRPPEIREEESPDQAEEIEDSVEDDIYVHISGAVENEGLFILEPGSRMNDLVEACGGLKKSADMSKVNLSMKLEDQMRLHVPEIGQDQDMDLFAMEKDDRINVNTASKEELMTLPNIGEKRAEAIIEERAKGKFESLEDLKRISGLGDKTIAKLEDLVKFR